MDDLDFTLQVIRLTKTIDAANAWFDYAQTIIACYPVRVALVSDGAGWIVDSLANDLYRRLRHRVPLKVLDAKQGRVLRRKVIHFLSNWGYFNLEGKSRFHCSNRIIVLWSWGFKEGSSNSEVRKLIPSIRQMSNDVSLFHVPCTSARDFLQSVGIPERKIVLVPQGIDLSLFRPPVSASARLLAKRKLGIPEDRFCVGLFHKDGNGWESGDEPKWPKGPDVFVDVMIRLSSHIKTFALIPGPARGYVRRKLEEHRIPVRADGMLPKCDLVTYYHASDIYMIPSREEGGPAGLLEAMATGTPVVSTRCGMALDLIKHGENGFLAPIEDAEALSNYALHLAKNRSLIEQFGEAGLRTVQPYDWEAVAHQHLEKLYLPLLQG